MRGVPPGDLPATIVRWADRPSWWGPSALVALLLVGAWVAVWAGGGTRSAWPHLFYVPIVVAALPLGLRGGLVAAVAATLLCGPAMPFDVAASEAQEAGNWLTRGAFFLTVGAVTGLTANTLRRGYEQLLTRQIYEELAGAPPPTSARPEPTLDPRILDVLQHRRFHPVYQPIWSLTDGRLLGAEALTRFEPEPIRPPNVWFEQAARSGLGAELEVAAIRAALEGASELPDDVVLHLNVSAATLEDERLLDLLHSYAARPLAVEITEHDVIDDYAALQRVLGRLRRDGVRLAIDDAGAGFASLRHVVTLAPEVLKLDVSLTQGVRDDPTRRALAHALIRFSEETDTHLIAEGIEEAADLRTWQELGAHAAQGYLLGRPEPLPLEVGPTLLIDLDALHAPPKARRGA